jgi:hypothetical protein
MDPVHYGICLDTRRMPKTPHYGMEPAQNRFRPVEQRFVDLAKYFLPQLRREKQLAD